MLRFVVVVAFGALWLQTPFARAADGNELQAVGAIQKGLAGAGVASPQDATWTLLNPASLVDLDRCFDTSLELLYNDFSAEPHGAPFVANPFAGRLRDRNIFVIPSFGYVQPLKRGTLGVGLYPYQGQRVNYDRARSAFGLIGNGDRRMQLEVVKIPISYGVELKGGWAVGASAVPVLARLRGDSVTPFLRPARGDYHWDLAPGFGLQFGVYGRWPHWSVGANYATRTWMGDFNLYEIDMLRKNLDFPQQLQIGVAWRPAPKWEWVLDYKWIDWSHIAAFGDLSTRGGVLWEDQHIFKTGVTWDIRPKWSLRAGLSWGRPPMREESVMPNALAPPLSEWHTALGVSYRMNAHSAFHLAISHVLPESMKDNGRGDLFSKFGRNTAVNYAEDAWIAQYSYSF